MLHVDESASSEHDSLEEQQADPTMASIFIFDNLQEFVQVDHRHIGMNELYIAAKVLIAEAFCWDPKDVLFLEKVCFHYR